jgi:hypothetical protein
VPLLPCNWGRRRTRSWARHGTVWWNRVDSGSSGKGKTLEDGTTARTDGKNRWNYSKNRWPEQMARTTCKQVHNIDITEKREEVCTPTYAFRSLLFLRLLTGVRCFISLRTARNELKLKILSES